MKKQTSIITALTIIVLLCACGTTAEGTSNAKDTEPFELRSGIHFGDTIDEVKEKEKELEFSSDFDSPKYGYLMEYNGSIAGYDGTAAFYFDDNDKLYEMYYSFFTTNNPWSFSDNTNPEDIYGKIFDSCSRQYGDPLGEKDEPPVAGYAVDEAVFQMQNNGAKAVKYDQWVILDENGIDGVKIDLVMFTRDNDFHGTTYTNTSIYISYLLFSQEDIDNYNSAIDGTF